MSVSFQGSPESLAKVVQAGAVEGFKTELRAHLMAVAITEIEAIVKATAERVADGVTHIMQDPVHMQLRVDVRFGPTQGTVVRG